MTRPGLFSFADTAARIQSVVAGSTCFSPQRSRRTQRNHRKPTIKKEPMFVNAKGAEERRGGENKLRFSLRYPADSAFQSEFTLRFNSV